MKSQVSYEKPMRDRAIADHKGLYTIDLIRAGSKPGKMGGRITLQGPITADEAQAIGDFIVKFLENRTAANGGPR